MVDFKGNMTTELWSTMGHQVVDGVTRDGQACYLVVYPTGTEATREQIAYEFETMRNEPQEAEPEGPIDEVMQTLLQNSIHFSPDADEDIVPYFGLIAGSGWIYGVLACAKNHGATWARIGISSNDGNYYVQAMDKDKGVYVTGVHNTYYGT